eukprot:3063003-Pyramimonas_sp.AAC.1
MAGRRACALQQEHGAMVTCRRACLVSVRPPSVERIPRPGSKRCFSAMSWAVFVSTSSCGEKGGFYTRRRKKRKQNENQKNRL